MHISDYCNVSKLTYVSDYTHGYILCTAIHKIINITWGILQHIHTITQHWHQIANCLPGLLTRWRHWRSNHCEPTRLPWCALLGWFGWLVGYRQKRKRKFSETYTQIKLWTICFNSSKCKRMHSHNKEQWK